MMQVFQANRSWGLSSKWTENRVKPGAALFGLEAKRSQDVGLRLLKGSNGIESTVSDPPEFFIFFR
jgi:hypothetical protein